jgi:hypothetical protein
MNLWVGSVVAVVLVSLSSYVISRSGLSVAVLLEVLSSWLSLGVVDSRVASVVTVGFKVWSLGVMSLVLAHVFTPLLSVSTLPFLLVYWMLLGTWLVVVPLAGCGVFSLRLISWIFSLMFVKGLGVVDLLSFSHLLRGIYGIGNYLFQLGYFSFRLWLVFVLHAFCLGAFMELLGSLESLFPVDFCFGISCMAIALGSMLVGYLGIQLYVYLSFSASFLSSGVVAWWNGFSLVAVSLSELASLNLVFLALLPLVSILTLSSSFPSLISFPAPRFYSCLSLSAVPYLCNHLQLTGHDLTALVITLSFQFGNDGPRR